MNDGETHIKNVGHKQCVYVCVLNCTCFVLFSDQMSEGSTEEAACIL